MQRIESMWVDVPLSWLVFRWQRLNKTVAGKRLLVLAAAAGGTGRQVLSRPHPHLQAGHPYRFVRYG